MKETIRKLCPPILWQFLSRLRRSVSSAGTAHPLSRSLIINEFHKLYYDAPGQTWENTRWLGRTILKCPLDLWVYQELLHEIRPDVIIETGTCEGGSAHFLATLCDLLGHGQVVTIDIVRKPTFPQHRRITYLTGSSTDQETVRAVRDLVPSDGKVLVILDSDHREEHVMNELRIYSDFVSTGSYLIVEDTNVNGHPVRCDFGPGPYEAVDQFLAHHRDFMRDRDCEKFLMTFNTAGYLKRVA